MAGEERTGKKVAEARTGTISRRSFVARSLACAGAASVGFPAIRASEAGAPPSDRIRVGHIGMGGRGMSLLGGDSLRAGDVDVVAVCDVDRQRLGAAQGEVQKAAGSKAEAYTDHRPILDRKDVDAVVIATPDHWHAIATIEACAAGKDVYVEKPLCTYVVEGRAMVKAARAGGRMVQVGINHRSADYMRAVCEIIQSGRIGTVKAVKIWVMPNPYKKRTPPSEPPAHLDYDRWLGPAPFVPYHPDRVHFNFRWCRDYAGGYTTDWGVHMLNFITYAMGIDDKGPDAVEATGTFAGDNLYDFPATMEARWTYSDPPFVLSWKQPSDGGDLLPGESYAMTFYGDRGELRTSFGRHAFYQAGKPAELPPAQRSVSIPQSPGHYRDWLNSIRSRKLPLADVEIGQRTTSTCIIANIALFTGRPLRWDWRAERFIGDAEADKLLSCQYRRPYVPRA